MALVLHNSLTRAKEPFEPLRDKEVGIYICGVTVWDKSHIGHAKSAVNFDVIVRYLRHRGYEVKHVTNFTDVDDKIIAKANELGTDPLKLSRSLIDEYFLDMDALKVRRADVYPKASETIPEIIAMVRGLVDKGYAYESKGSVYFSVHKAKEYGRLSGQSLDQMHAGARIEIGEDKRDPMDFALWKAAKPGEVSWDSPWGKGRPGWHIECSAMCLKHIGKTVDIHGGGTDLVFPHHENEILQSEAYNEAPFVRYWMHNGLLTIDQEKMSKSLKNFFTVSEVLQSYPPEVVRFFFLNASYRAPLEYNEKSLDEAKQALERLQNTYNAVQESLESASGEQDAKDLCDKTWRQIEDRMDDDFSTREAIAVMFDSAREANRMLSEGKLSKQGVRDIADLFSEFNKLFDVLRTKITRAVAIPQDTEEPLPDPESLTGKALSDADVDQWVRYRGIARRRKDFDYSDAIRKKLAELGIDVQDAQDGAVWKRR